MQKLQFFFVPLHLEFYKDRFSLAFNSRDSDLSF